VNPFDKKLNRRNFMGLVGGSCAIIGAASLVPRSASAQHQGQPPSRGGGKTKVKKNAVEGTMKQVSTDVLVVGGGMAGVFAAVKAHDAGANVILVDKGAVGKSGQTPFARGIFRYDEQETGMSKKEYLSQTANAAEHMNHPAYTKLMLDDGPARIEELATWGFFDELGYAKAMNRPLNERKITVYERVTLTNLLKLNGRVAGAVGMYIDQNESLTIHAKSVVLCTGASGFKPSGWQIGSLTSDGDAMAYRIGAEISGKEWVDGHSRTNGGLEGTNNIESSSNIFAMLGVEENVEVEKNGPGGSMMMGPPPGAGEKDGHPMGPPSGTDGDKHHGPPPGGGGDGEGPTSMGGASAGMSQHKAEGLFPVDDKCGSNILGLYAAGDSLSSMQSGGIYTQIGSSLVGSAAQGAVAGKAAADYSKNVALVKTSSSALKQINTEIYAPFLRTRGFSPQWVTQTLQGIMIPNFILYVKSEERLQAALTYIEYLRDHQVPLLMADDLHELRQCHETANMVLNAEMKLRASLMRKETRGSHYREDYPDCNDNDWLCWIKIRRANDGKMDLIKHPVG